MGLEVEKTRQPVTEEKKANNELDGLKCPKLSDLSPDEAKKHIWGEGVALNNAAEFNKYIGKSIDRRGAELTFILSQATEQVMREMGMGQTTKREALDSTREVQDLEFAIKAGKRKKTVKDMDEERQAKRKQFTDNVKLEKRQDMASKGESDGREVKSPDQEEELEESPQEAREFESGELETDDRPVYKPKVEGEE